MMAVEPEDLGTPCRRSDQPQQQSNGRRLARTVGAEVSHDLPAGYLEAEVAQRIDIAVALGQAFGSNSRGFHLVVPPYPRTSKLPSWCNPAGKRPPGMHQPGQHQSVISGASSPCSRV